MMHFLCFFNSHLCSRGGVVSGGGARPSWQPAERATSDEGARKERGRCRARFPLPAVVGSVGMGCKLAGLAPPCAAALAFASVPRFFSALPSLRFPSSSSSLAMSLWLPFGSLRFAAIASAAAGKAPLWAIAEKKARPPPLRAQGSDRNEEPAQPACSPARPTRPRQPTENAPRIFLAPSSLLRRSLLAARAPREPTTLPLLTTQPREQTNC